MKKIIVIILMVILVNMNVSCVHSNILYDEGNNKTEVFNNSEDNLIVVTFEEPASTSQRHKYELLDNGVISFMEYTEKGGVFGSGYKAQWIFSINKPGMVRIKWENPNTLKRWKNADSWIDTYTIDEDMTYTVERYYLDEYMNYFLYKIEQTDKGKKVEGYFIDINGDKRVYNIEDNENSINNVKDLYDYLMAHFSDYKNATFCNTEGLQKCNEALMKVPDYLYDGELELIYDKKILYGVNDSNGEIRFLVCATEDSLASNDENIKLIMRIFGDDWDKYEP